MSRTVGKSLLPADVEELIHRLYPTQYAFYYMLYTFTLQLLTFTLQLLATAFANI